MSVRRAVLAPLCYRSSEFRVRRESQGNLLESRHCEERHGASASPPRNSLPRGLRFATNVAAAHYPRAHCNETTVIRNLSVRPTLHRDEVIGGVADVGNGVQVVVSCAALDR